MLRTSDVHIGAPHAGTSAELGKGVVMGSQALGPFKTLAMTQGGGRDTDTKKDYGEEDITSLMGFLNITTGNQLQDIWAYFQSAGSKNINICR